MPYITQPHTARSRLHPIKLPAVEKLNRPIIQFVTICTKNRRPCLANHAAHALLRQVWSEGALYHVGHYLLMPDHIHFFCGPQTSPPEDLWRWIEYWKSRTAARWPVRGFKVWQRHGWDTQIRSGRAYAEKWEYVQLNPVRAELVTRPEDWPYQGNMFPLPWNE